MVEFKKEFLWRDDKRIEGIKQDYTNVLKKYENIFPVVEKAIGRPITEAEKLELVESRDNALLSFVRPLYQFPNADDTFNLQALGLKLDAVINQLKQLPPAFSRHEFEDGQLVLTEEFENEIVETNTYYTQNLKQNEALAAAKKAIAALEEIEELGFIDVYGKNQIERVTRLLSIPLGSGGKIVPNRYTIKDIRDNS